MPVRKYQNKEVYEYRSKLKGNIFTTRFNNKTYEENREFCKKNSKMGCIYSAEEPIGQNINIQAIILVLEMNNEKNRVMGIGMIQNNPIYKKYEVYQEGRYNTFSYVGKYRIDREEITEEEEEIMKVFDILCFKGSRHLKRLKGIKAFPIDMLYGCSKIKDLVEFVTNMFKKRFIEKNNENKKD